MNAHFKTRQFYQEELRFLKKLRKRKEKANPDNNRLRYFMLAGLLGCCFAWLALKVQETFWVLPLGTLAVLCFFFVVYGPYLWLQMRRRNRLLLDRLDAIIEQGTVSTWVINAKNMALAKEYEDESDLYIIEYATDQILYLWDTEYDLRNKLNCLDFEIYEPEFAKISGRKIHNLDNKTKPIEIDKTAKWNYLKKTGIPEHLHTEHRNFNQLLTLINEHA